MASQQQLIDIVSQVQGVERPTVEIISRNLREAGLLTTGKRGRAPAQMTVTDAANLIIGVVASKGPTSAVETVNTYRASRDERRGGGKRITFGEYLDFILDEARKDRLSGYATGMMKKAIQREAKDNPPYIIDSMKKRYSSLRSVGVRVLFQRPMPAALVSIDVFPELVPLPGEMSDRVLEKQFLPEDERTWQAWNEMKAGPDRKEVIQISERTLFAVAEGLEASA